MPRIVSLGPIDGPEGPRYVLTLLDAEGSSRRRGRSEIASTAGEGLQRWVDELGAGGFEVGPELAEEAAALGLKVSEHPPNEARTRALLVMRVLNPEGQGADVHPSSFDFLVEAAAELDDAAPWRWLEQPVDVSVERERGRPESYIVKAEGGEGAEYDGLVIAPKRRAAARARGGRAVDHSSSLLLARAPEWACEAMDLGYGVDFVPLVAQKRRGALTPMTDHELLMLAAITRGLADLEPDMSRHELDLEAATGEGFFRINYRPRQNQLPPGARPLGELEAVGRNAPCPCGSGRKFKRCCMNQSPA